MTDPLVAEALALRDGVLFARPRGFLRVVLEVDCKDVVALWASCSMVASVLLEIEELALSFQSFVIQHISRKANTPAHFCAKFACTLGVTSCWMDSPPSFFMTSIMAHHAGARDD